MADQIHTEPDALSDLVSTATRVCDRHPEIVERVHALLVDRVQNGPKVQEDDPWAHIGQHIKDWLPVVMRDKSLVDLHPAILEEWDQLTSTSANRLSKGPGENSIVTPIAVGATVIGLLASGAIAHCLAEVHPAEGTSAEVPHIPLIC